MERLWSEYKEIQKINREKLAITKAAEISKKHIDTEMKIQFNLVIEKYAEVSWKNFNMLFSADILIEINNIVRNEFSCSCNFKKLKRLFKLTKVFYFMIISSSILPTVSINVAFQWE